jgi:hypothetical protein
VYGGGNKRILNNDVVVLVVTMCRTLQGARMPYECTD